MSTDKVCCICNGPIDPHTTPEGKVYWTHGHNALPVKDGRCCTDCNNYTVLTARARLHRRSMYDDIDCHPNYDADTDSIRE